MFDNVLVGILVLAATFTVGLFIGWRFWANVAKEANADKRDLELGIENERRKGTAILQQRDDAKTELDLHRKRIAELEAELATGASSSVVVVTDSGDAATDKTKTRAEAAEKARSEAEARAQLAEARAMEAEKRLAETDVKARGADTLIKKMESRSSPEIDEAKARREAEAKAKSEAETTRAKTDADAKAKADEHAAKAKADEHAAKAKADEHAAKAKADAEAKAKAEEQAAKAKPEADVKAKAAGPTKPAGVSDAFWAMFGPNVPVADASAADEIVGGIKGIGPVTGKRLNELGIYTYAQIAAFDADTIARVAAAVGAIPAKVAKEDWPGQARKKLGGAT